MLTMPSKEAVERIAGSLGDHDTSKFQLDDAGSSHMIWPVLGFQQSVRLSLPHVSSIDVSNSHQDMARMPRLCPDSTLAGECALRRSHIWRIGVLSSSEATMTCVATSGFHARAARDVLLTVSVKEMTGRFCRKSQTTDVPLAPVEARMCSTLGFHATQLMSMSGCVGAPGVYTSGFSGFCKFQIRISDSVAPEASRLGLKGLKSKPRTGPLCF
mmetsp:Transcript_29472/g.70885  ORF Transcript_29472/g.70885 Transcript_29472/m.70885 type:complete len:214 (-) Transcript_29472:482-1123(-)